MNKKIYFASDFHLGIPDYEASLIREKKIVRWLDEIKTDAAEIFLVGDLFDFWFEHRYQAPKYFVRLLGKIAEITDSGIPVHFFKGNHDMWTFGYLEKELNVKVHSNELIRTFGDKKFYIHHGDGLGPGDYGYKFLKKVFRNPISQWLFARLHPNFAFWLATSWSKSKSWEKFKPEEKPTIKNQEWLYLYSEEILKQNHYDYFIFGHRHKAFDIPLSQGSRYINLGDWMYYFTYAVFDGKNLELKKYE